MPGYGFSGKPATPGRAPRRIARRPGRADEAPRIHCSIRGTRRRLGRGYHGRYGYTGTSGTAWHSHQHARRGSRRHCNRPPWLAPRRLAACHPMKGMPTRSWPSSMPLAWVTPKRCIFAHRRSTDLRIHRSASRHGSSITTTLVSHLFHASSMVKPRASREMISSNITLYWLTQYGVRARLYSENTQSFFATRNVTIPVAVSAFPDELYPCPRSWAERAYPANSFITTSSTKADTLRPGSSRNSFQKRFAQDSDRCVN